MDKSTAAIALCTATQPDLPLLAAMNRRLIKDEGSRNPMDEEALRARLAGWMRRRVYHFDLFTAGDIPVGYAAYQVRREQYEPERTNVFLRHFYIEREYRRRGLGRAAFDLLVQTRFPTDASIDLNVLTDNLAGQRFWASVGFAPFYTAMRRA